MAEMMINGYNTSRSGWAGSTGSASPDCDSRTAHGAVADDFPTRVLLGFAPVELRAGASERVTVRGSTRPLQRWTSGGFVPSAPTAVIEASAYAGDPRSVPAELRLG
jgi:beta-glucosidase